MVTQPVETTPEVASAPTPGTQSVRGGDAPVGSGRDAAIGAGERRRTLVVWLVSVVAFVLFVGLARVSREAGAVPGEVPIRRVWWALIDNLPILGSGTLSNVLFVAAVVVFLAAAAVELWLALIVGGHSEDVPPASPEAS